MRNRIIWLALVQVLFLILAAGCVNSIFLHPETARTASVQAPIHPAHYGDVPQRFTVTNESGRRLNGWCFSASTNHGVVLIGDGNATGIEHTYEYNRYLLHRGFNIVILSYQGFDNNEGKADLDSLIGDVRAFYGFCQKKFPGQPIAFVAESLSTAPFFCFASRHEEIAGIVLEAMVDLRTVALSKAINWWPLYPIFPIIVPTVAVICAQVPADLSVQKALQEHSQVPALFIHHPEDRVTPYRIARRIYERYEGPKEFMVLQTDRTGEFHMTGAYESDIKDKIAGFVQHVLREGRAKNLSEAAPASGQTKAVQL